MACADELLAELAHGTLSFLGRLLQGRSCPVFEPVHSSGPATPPTPSRSTRPMGYQRID